MMLSIRKLRWLMVLAISGGFCALAVAMVLAQAAVFSHPAQHSGQVREAVSPLAKTYFNPERLDAFSGYGFNLRPNLVEFLNMLEDSLYQVRESNPEPLPQFNQVQRFINPDAVTFEIYRVQPGDNFWKIAKIKGYTIDTIVGCNPQLEQVICYTNQYILLPSQGGSLHHVQPEESVDTIGLDYAVPTEAILSANTIDPMWGVVPDMWLFIPGAKPRYFTEKMHQEYSKRALFRSPLAGRYTSFVGMRLHPVLGFSKFHNGVDIACPNGTWVGAAAAGTVVAAGWGGAVGKYIKINHHNGYQTLYGHLNAIYVRSGQKVERGQLIGRAGATGRVTGPHLHFTLWDHGRVRDPMDYLW